MMRGLPFHFIVLIIFTTCKKADLGLINNLNENKILIVGHGGDGFQTGRHPIPTNSELSFEKAIEMHNADGCEMDVMMSKDSVLMLFHDDDLEKRTDCRGCIPEMTAAELMDFRYKMDFSVNHFQDEKIITLEKLFDKYINSPFQPKFFLDVKTTPSCGKDSEAYLDLVAIKLKLLLTKYGNLENQVYVVCGNKSFLNKMKTTNPNLKLIINVGSGDFNEGVNLALQNNFYGVEVNNNDVTREQVQKAHANNLWVLVYSVKTQGGHVDAVNKSPEVIETDNVPLLQEILR